MRLAVAAADLRLFLPGAEMVARFAEAAGHQVDRISAKAPAAPELFWRHLPAFDGRYDVILINVMTPAQKWWLWLHREEIRRHAKRVIVGGQAAGQLSDAAFEFADVIVSGPVFSVEDIAAVLEAPRGSRVELSWARRPPAMILRMPGGYPPAIFPRIACPHGCPYCSSVQGDWSLEPAEVVEAIAREVPPGRAVRVYVPDGDLPLGLRRELWRRGRWTVYAKNMYPSTFLRFLEDEEPELLAEGYPRYRDYIVGVEGVSERLRRLIGRELATEALLQILLSDRVQQINLIAGLPTEGPADWEELVSVVAGIRGIRRYVHANCTPLEWSPWWRWGEHSAPSEAWEWFASAKARLKADPGNRFLLVMRRMEGLHRKKEWMNAHCPFDKKGALNHGKTVKKRDLG